MVHGVEAMAIHGVEEGFVPTVAVFGAIMEVAEDAAITLVNTLMLVFMLDLRIKQELLLKMASWYSYK